MLSPPAKAPTCRRTGNTSPWNVGKQSSIRLATRKPRQLTPATVSGKPEAQPETSIGGSHRYLTHGHSNMEAHLTSSQEASQSQWPDAMPSLRCHARLRRRTQAQQCRSRPHHSACQRRTRRTIKRHRHMSKVQPIQRQPPSTQSNNGFSSQTAQNQPSMVTCG